MGPLVSGNDVAGGALARKLGIKLLQRLALTFLEPRLAPWRYCRESGGDLERTLAGGAATTTGGVDWTGEAEDERTAQGWMSIRLRFGWF